MSVKYPVVIYETCQLCGACAEACKHGVFGKVDSKRPEVADPDACADGCYDCGDVCPADSIMYFGHFADGCGCGECGCGCGDEECGCGGEECGCGCDDEDCEYEGCEEGDGAVNYHDINEED